LNDQASRRGNLVGSGLSRLDENLSNNTDGTLHVETDAVDYSCNVVHSDDDLSFEYRGGRPFYSKKILKPTFSLCARTTP
jgi:hypothetical protein